MLDNLINITKLIRKTANTQKWWYTLRWCQDEKGKDGSFLEARFVYDSKEFDSYRKCLKEATIHKGLRRQTKRISDKERLKES
jgi:hypothetical protein